VDAKRDDDPDADLILSVLDTPDMAAARAVPGPSGLVDELVRVRAIMHAFDHLSTEPAPAPPPQPTWGPFVLHEQAGRGSFGTVFRGFDPAVHREIAIKLYSGEALPAEPRLLARVRHPNVVTVFGAAVYDGRPGIWMDFVHGRTLEERVRAEGPLPTTEVVAIGVALCEALEAVHGAQLLHQDVKPRNVMQEDSGRVVLMDFGAGSSREIGELPQRVSGTPVYMAPEVLLGGEPSAESDVYSLGVLLYYLLTGTYPAYAPDVEELRRMHERHHRAGTRRFVAWLRELRPEVSATLARCLARALAPVGQRYRSAAEFGQALRAIRFGLWRPQRWRAALAVAAVLALGIGLGIATRHTATAPPLVVTRLVSDVGLTTDPAISADGKLVAFASDRDNDSGLDIWIQQIAGGDALRITSDPADDAEPSFAPDGSKIVFRSERDGGGLYVVPTLGGEARRIADGGHWPRFSPDGRFLAYISEGLRGLTLCSSDGRLLREIPANMPPEAAPIWAADSRGVLIVVQGVHGRASDWSDWDWAFVPVDGDAAARPILTKADDAIGAQRRSYLEVRPRPWSWHNNHVLFSAALGDTTNLWEIDIDRGRLRVEGPTRRLTTSTQSEIQPTTGLPGRIVFASQTRQTEIWAQPTDAGGIPVDSPGRVETVNSSGYVMGALSENGRWLVVESEQLGRSSLMLRDLGGATRRPLTTASQSEKFPCMTRDGARVFYQSLAIGGKTAVTFASRATGITTEVCSNCGFPTDVSADERYLLLQHDHGGHASLELLELSSGRRVDVLNDAEDTLFRGHFSPDGRWVVFHVALKNGGTQEFVAPFSGPQVIARDRWIPLTDGRAATDAPRWSLDGNDIYYLSRRDGYLCIWRQRLDRGTKRPVGDPIAFFHSHGRQRSIANVTVGGSDILIARDKVVFSMAEIKGGLWVADGWLTAANRGTP
jgi:Tol biopolymer transport system component